MWRIKRRARGSVLVMWRLWHTRFVKPLIGTAALLLLVCVPMPVHAAASQVNQGRLEYVRYCASCHGVAADGRGPVAPALKQRPTDLRYLAGRYGAPLPRDRIARFIDGREAVPAHGSREMPVWGERLQQKDVEGSPREDLTRSHIGAILTYLTSIQMPAQR